MIQAHPERYFQTDITARAFTCWTVARLLSSHWHNCSTVAGTVVQQSLARLFNSHWRDCSTVSGTNVQQSLAKLFNSGWHDSSAVTGITLQQSLAGLFNSQGQIFLFSMLAEFFNSEDNCWRIVLCTRNTAHDPCNLIAGEYPLQSFDIRQIPILLRIRAPLTNWI